MDAIVGGIELTGTLFTSAQGDAKDKLAYTDQIYDSQQNKSQKEINAVVKGLVDGNAANTITSDDVDEVCVIEQ